MVSPQLPELPQGCTTTSIEGTVKEAPLPSPGNKRYLMEKAEFAIKFPKLGIRGSKSGDEYSIELKQVVMSGLIRADEYRFGFNWDYKAEVSFDMRFVPPRPFLSSSLGAQDPGRRHSLTPFPKGFLGGKLRRPDITIVKDKSVRWPGQAGPDHQGLAHPDNLERIVEVKFPGDELHEGQRMDYIFIAGTPDKFSVLEVIDCRDNGERERDREYNAQTNPTLASDPRKWPFPVERPKEAPTPVPVYGPAPTAKPAYLEAWTLAQEVVEGLREDGKNAIEALSQEVRQYFEDVSAWLTQKGEWIRQETGKAWEWVSESTGEVMRWTDEQVREMWKEVQKYTDLSLEMLKEITWVQWLGGIAATVALVVIVVNAPTVVAFVAAIPASLIFALASLVRMVHLFWPKLVPILSAPAALVGANA